MGGDALEPWWLAIGVGACTALVGALGKVWADGKAESKAERERLTAQLAAANARIEVLTQEAAERSDEAQREHRRDLRRVAGLSSSMDPPPPGQGWPPPIIRERAPRARAAPKKS